MVLAGVGLLLCIYKRHAVSCDKESGGRSLPGNWHGIPVPGECNFINDIRELMVAVFGEQDYSRNACDMPFYYFLTY